MADEKRPAPPAEAVAVSHIVEQSDEVHDLSVKADALLAGKYRVTHGSLHLGLKNPKDHNEGHHIAHRGAIVQLTAIDAHNALRVGTVEPVDPKQPGKRPALQFSDEDRAQSAS